MQRELFENRDYRNILLAVIISFCGDTVFDLFIIWKITIDSKNIMNAAYMLGSSLAFRGSLSLGIGILIDKLNKKKLMFISNIFSAVIIFLFWIFYDISISHIIVGICFILANDICNTVFASSYIVVASEKFNTETFIKFQSFITLLKRIITIGGSLLVGWLISILSGSVIFIADVISFLIASFFVSKIFYNKEIKDNEEKDPKFYLIKELIEDVKTAYVSIIKDTLIRGMVIVIFLLNLAYGIIPNILPVMLAEKLDSGMMLGCIKSMMAIGEIIGLLIVNKYGHLVSSLFKIAMIACVMCMVSLIFINGLWLSFIFMLYGLFDSTTQPLFSYVISNIDEKDRGKIIGGIDTILLISPSIGIAIGTKILTFNFTLGLIYLASIFVLGFLITAFNNKLNNIKLENRNEQIN